MRKLIHIITEEDVKHPYSALMEHIHKPDHSSFDYAKLLQCMGRLLPCDVGKRVYEVGDIYQVENNEQKESNE